MGGTAVIELYCPNGYVKIVVFLNVVSIGSWIDPFSGETVYQYDYSPTYINIEGHGTFEEDNITSINIISAPQVRSDGSITINSLTEFNNTYRYTQKGELIDYYAPCTLDITSDSIGMITDVSYQLVLGQQILYSNVNVYCYSLVGNDKVDNYKVAFYNINSWYWHSEPAAQNAIINVHCHKVGKGSFYLAHVNTIVAIADEYDSLAFMSSDVYHVRINPDVKLPLGIFRGCSNLIDFSEKKIKGVTYINYVHDIELDNRRRGESQFEGCDNITVFSLNKLVDIDWASNLVDNTFKVTNPYVVTDLYTNSQTIKDNAYRWHSKYGRDVDASHIHDMPDGAVWNIVDQGVILEYDPQQVQDNNCIYMMHEGALVRFKLVLPSDPLASDVYIKHNGVLMCLANN